MFLRGIPSSESFSSPSILKDVCGLRDPRASVLQGSAARMDVLEGKPGDRTSQFVQQVPTGRGRKQGWIPIFVTVAQNVRSLVML